jgi:hypothetical protein
LRKLRSPSCEIASDLCPNPLSHDWHVQPNFQRPNHDPPERRAFSPEGDAQVRIHPSSKPFNHTARRKSRQSRHPTEFPRVFHNGNLLCDAPDQRLRPSIDSRLDAALKGRSSTFSSTQQYGLPLGPQSEMALNGACFSGRAKAEDKKLRKELNFGGPCFEGTLQETGCCTVPESRPRGRGQFLGVIF